MSMATTQQQKEFLSRIIPLAKADMKKTKILASLTIAQAILESGWGTSALARKSNNLFGIKGSGKNYKTFEYINGKRVDIVDSFKVYPDWETSVTDHSGLFLRLSRYQNLIGERDYKKACRKVYEDGYATAPNYAEALIRIIEQYKLYEHDYENCIVQYVVVAESKPLTMQSSDNLIRTLKKYGMTAVKKEVLI